MSIHVALNHVTHYRYDRPIHLGPQVVRLRPAPHSRTRILSYSMRVEPSGHFINWQQDPQSNYLARLVFPHKTSSMRIEIDLVAEMAVLNPFDFFLVPSSEHFPFVYDGIEAEARGLLERYLDEARLCAPALNLRNATAATTNQIGIRERVPSTRKQATSRTLSANGSRMPPKRVRQPYRLARKPSRPSEIPARANRTRAHP
jgi:transglutaminase-like putative cysteine protease